MECDQDGQPQHPLPMKRVWQSIFDDEPWPQCFVFQPGGQFVVRRDAIKRRPRETYVRCHALLGSRADSVEGSVFERLWSYLFHAPVVGTDSTHFTERGRKHEGAQNELG
jgi:hypothetical protein